MLALADLQRTLRRAILEQNERALRELDLEIASGNLTVHDRVGVYRNNIVASLTEALRETFPVVHRLVGDDFFAFAASQFVASHPPSHPVLSEYGDAFPAFLATFPSCRDLIYLSDTAQFEWLMNVAASAAETKPASPECFSGTAPEDTADLTFAFHPSYGYLASPWPIDRIWRANQAESQDQSVDLDAGGVRLEVAKQGDSVVFRALDEGVFDLRRSLSQGATLGVALENALAARADFDAANALTALFYEGAVIAVGRASSKTERGS